MEERSKDTWARHRPHHKESREGEGETMVHDRIRWSQHGWQQEARWGTQVWELQPGGSTAGSLGGTPWTPIWGTRGTAAALTGVARRVGHIHQVGASR